MLGTVTRRGFLGRLCGAALAALASPLLSQLDLFTPPPLPVDEPAATLYFIPTGEIAAWIVIETKIIIDNPKAFGLLRNIGA